MRFFLLLAAVTLALASVSAQSQKQNHSTEQEIRALELAHADAVLRGDLAAMDKIWTADYSLSELVAGKSSPPREPEGYADRLAIVVSVF